MTGARFYLHFLFFGALLTPTTLVFLLYLMPVFLLKCVFLQLGSDRRLFYLFLQTTANAIIVEIVLHYCITFKDLRRFFEQQKLLQRE